MICLLFYPLYPLPKENIAIMPLCIITKILICSYPLHPYRDLFPPHFTSKHFNEQGEPVISKVSAQFLHKRDFKNSCIIGRL